MFEVLEAALLSLEQLDHSTARSSLDHLVYSESAYFMRRQYSRAILQYELIEYLFFSNPKDFRT